ncbi:ubiquitin carboxyl-terminal hydrolase 19 isoform X4 [Xenopus tropicalis]|uniref:Ubiquitin carboxyl-terminal hydrolase 19 n=1 Tax=Xenopus tropicalis TaxID=8364 RepID=A0A8J0SKP7_XENTR|nr:ubiquitin carboxyl-terminal hydrolase 19 isoform X4 [Xenopus tropicalis]|eukprot:XP_012816887.1 PREDICTED: ubiquitin carboxyl-terminal hydrolase 19 isoform X4 [Xenopus tropicalis]
MSHPAEGANQRRVTRGTADAINRKKQKDKANQESKEGKAPTNAGPQKDIVIDWKQNSEEVIVKLNAGSRALNVEELNAEFTDTDCVISFPEGQQWKCQFHEEIEGSCSKIQYKEKGNILQIILQKKIPFNKWPTLQKKKKESMKEQVKAGALMENGKPKVSLKLPLPDKSQTQPSESTDARKGKPDHRSVRRGQETTEASSGVKSSLTRKSISTAVHSGVQMKRGCHKSASVIAGGDSSPQSQKVAGSEDLSSRGLNKRNVQIPSGNATWAGHKSGDSQAELQNAQRDQNKSLGKEKMPALDQQVLLQEAGPTLQPACLHAVEKQNAPIDLNSVIVAPCKEMLASTSEQTLDCQQELSKMNLNLEVKEVVVKPHSDSALSDATELGGPPKKVDSPTEDCLEDTTEEPEPIVNLTFVKNDHYEKGNDVVVVHVYVKEICKETSRVLFREQDFTLIFKTRDPNFLRLHPNCTPDTVFRWQVKLRNLIEPDLCRYCFTGARVDISLQKKQCQRWGGLEAPATQGAVGGAKVAMPAGPPPHDKTQPGSNQHSLSNKEEARAVEKEKPRAEDTGLDKVSSRTPTDHVSVKSEQLLSSPKPTCMVPPMTHSAVSSENVQEEEEKRVCPPGFTGLVNLGNTCFMNSVIQSLSNTRELRDYFQDRSFESEINCNNPLGTGGRLAVSFAVLLRALWKGTHHAFQPSKLKAIVASKASQFTGYAQHDAQEFMAFLLDGLHEDLNRIQNKPYTETVDSDGRPDEEVADEAWLRHKMRNDSFVVDLFQGQYKSKLVCPVCAKVSITFDPFLYLPVPLPQKQKVLTVYYFAREPHKKPIKFLVSISKENSSAAEVLESISKSVRVKAENLQLAEVVKNRFQRIFRPSCSLDSVSPNDLLFCFEVLSKELSKERVVVFQVQQRPQVPSIPITKCAACQKKQMSEEEKLKRCTRCYRVGYCNQVCQKSHWPDHKTACRPENIGYPFLISVPESRLTYSRLAQLLEGYARYSVNVFQPPFIPGRTSPDHAPQPLSSEKADLPPQSDLPLLGESSEEEKDFHSVQSSQTTLPPLTCLSASGDSGIVHGKPPGDRVSLYSTDSGFSEHSTDTVREMDSGGEKETIYEKSVKPEAAVAGFQQSESVNVHASAFYINVIDPNNKEMKLEDKGESPLELTEDCSLALVWKNNERAKEFVLVESKELECEEDPGSASEAARAGLFTLDQCLNLFTKPEVLAPEEAWYCPKCNQHREASKQLMLWRLPNILIIQLKRFSFRTFIWRDKINDMVDFPVRNLDLSTFCIGQKEDHQRPIYDLYAVINHYGGMIGGHYTAYARLPNEKNSQRSDVGWRLFDDSTVTTVDESQVVTRYAYVLFYRRRNSPVERPMRGHPADRRVDAGASADVAGSQASLLWQQLEAEEDELHRRLDLSRSYRAPSNPNATEPQLSEFSDEVRIRYFVLGTMAAIVAFFLNVFYPFMYQSHGR